MNMTEAQLMDRFREKLAKRGNRGIMGLGRSFKIADDDRSGNLGMEEFQKAMDMPALPPWMTTHRPGALRSNRTGGAEESSASASIRQPVRMKTVGSGGAADAPELPPWMTTHKSGSDPSPALQKEEAPEVAEDSDDDPLYDLD